MFKTGLRLKDFNDQMEFKDIRFSSSVEEERLLYRDHIEEIKVFSRDNRN